MRTHQPDGLAHQSRPAGGLRLRVTFARADSAADPDAPLFADVREVSDAYSVVVQAAYVVYAGGPGPGMDVDFEIAADLDPATAAARLEELAALHRLKVVSSGRQALLGEDR